MQRVYFDNSATTLMDSRVLEKMLPYLKDNFGNASSIHSYGQKARVALSEAREKIATVLNASPAEIIFTSGGTESDNLAIKGLAYLETKRRHIITSAIEHHAVLNTIKYLEKKGFRVTYLPVDQTGMVDPEAVRRHISDDTFLISMMHANNEVGTINPIDKIGELAREHKVFFHCDAVQSFGKIPVDVKSLKVDLLSISGHKIYGPKGSGALYVRKGILLEMLNHGGHHEYNRRAGTENIPAIVGFGEAATICQQEMKADYEKVKSLRDELFQRIQSVIPDVFLNGHPEKRLPGHLNLAFKGIEGEALLLSLDFKGVAASSGSACTSGATEPSHVLLAMGTAPFLAQSSIRFTLGRQNTTEDIDYTLEVLPEVVSRLRKISPFN
ncbi:cysteine desulfurase NifS [candidate division KSB1 bacterium]|nr:cysteine desulfurase NifS [candidate division KSB1 bacterium]